MMCAPCSETFLVLWCCCSSLDRQKEIMDALTKMPQLISEYKVGLMPGEVVPCILEEPNILKCLKCEHIKTKFKSLPQS